uniref:Protein HIRA-like C-terminal domain-containing protein n=1 Tax=Ditylenchus dipsaci TaxID=166011 RepID=A0A915CPK1_9BILA
MKESSNSGSALKSKLAGGVQKRRIQATYLGAIGQADGVVQSLIKPTASTQSNIESTAMITTQQKSSSEIRMALEMESANANLLANFRPSTSQTQSKHFRDSDTEIEDANDLTDSNQVSVLSSKHILRPLPDSFNAINPNKDLAALSAPSLVRELSSRFEQSDHCPVNKVCVFNDLSTKNSTARFARLIAYDENIPEQTTTKKQTAKKVVWEILLNNPVTLLQANSCWCVAACDNRSMHILHTSSGKTQRLLQMDVAICVLHLQDDVLLIIDSKFCLLTWNLKTSSLVVKKSLAVLFTNKESKVVHQSVSSTGIPLVILSNGDAFVYSKQMDFWLTLNTGFNSLLSSMVGQMKLISSSVPNGLIAMLAIHLPKAEERLSGNKKVHETSEEVQLEALINACIALESPFELRFITNIYAQKLAKRGQWAKLIESVQEVQNLPMKESDLSDKILEDVEQILQAHGITLNQLMSSREDIDLSFMD